MARLVSHRQHLHQSARSAGLWRGQADGQGARRSSLRQPLPYRHDRRCRGTERQQRRAKQRSPREKPTRVRAQHPPTWHPMLVGTLADPVPIAGGGANGAPDTLASTGRAQHAAAQVAHWLGPHRRTAVARRGASSPARPPRRRAYFRLICVVRQHNTRVVRRSRPIHMNKYKNRHG
eukprot:scaffold25741_cov155-Isochrysis_galbana.AAC.2